MKRPFPQPLLLFGTVVCLCLSSCSQKSELSAAMEDAQARLTAVETELEATSQKTSSIRSEADAFEKANPDSFRALKVASRANDRLEAIEIHLNQALIDADRQLKEMNAAHLKYRTMFVKP